jgi:hypothetical protein
MNRDTFCEFAKAVELLEGGEVLVEITG